MLKRPGAFFFILDDKRRKVRRWLQSNAAPAMSVVQSSGISGETSAGRGAAEIRQRTEGGGSQGGSLGSPPFGSLTLCFLLPPSLRWKIVILQHSKLGRWCFAFRSVKSTPTNAQVVQSEKQRSPIFASVDLMFACHLGLQHCCPTLPPGIYLIQPYLLAVILLFLAFLFVAQLLCECKATPAVRWRTTRGRRNK